MTRQVVFCSAIALLVMASLACGATSVAVPTVITAPTATPVVASTVTPLARAGAPPIISTVAAATRTSAPVIAPPSVTPVIMCTPPACRPGEVYYCAGSCPGGCGTQCATATPSPGQPTQLAATGPWWLISVSDGLWAVNSDGSGLTHLTRQPVIAPSDLRAAVSPRGGHVAFITSTDPELWQNLTLNLLALPGGRAQMVTRLTNASTEPGPDTGAGDPAFEAARAMVELTSVAWSPDGRQLAFIGAQDGPSADLYVYSLDSGRVTRLTDGPSQAFRPSWSPDGKYIVQAGADSFGTGAGYSMVGVWAARADGTQVKSLYTPQSIDEVVIGWSAPDTFLVYSARIDCGSVNLRAFNIETGAVRPLWKDYFNDVALDPVGGSLLLAVDRYTVQCNTDKQQGLFLIPPGKASQRVTATEGYQSAGRCALTWSVNAGLFLARTDGGALAIKPTGDAIQLAAPLEAVPVVSPGGQRWAWSATETDGTPGLWVGPLNQKPAQVSSGPATRLAWSPGSQSLFFFGGDGLYIARAPDYKPVLMTDKLDVTSGGAVWVSP